MSDRYSFQAIFHQCTNVRDPTTIILKRRVLAQHDNGIVVHLIIPHRGADSKLRRLPIDNQYNRTHRALYLLEVLVRLRAASLLPRSESSGTQAAHASHGNDGRGDPPVKVPPRLPDTWLGITWRVKYFFSRLYQWREPIFSPYVMLLDARMDWCGEWDLNPRTPKR